MQMGELPPDDSALARLRGDGGRSWVWVVSNTEFDEGSGFRGGRSLSISAETGELLEDVRWEATP
jgi:hypothetical protein